MERDGKLLERRGMQQAAVERSACTTDEAMRNGRSRHYSPFSKSAISTNHGLDRYSRLVCLQSDQWQRRWPLSPNSDGSGGGGNERQCAAQTSAPMQSRPTRSTSGTRSATVPDTDRMTVEHGGGAARDGRFGMSQPTVLAHRHSTN